MKRRLAVLLVPALLGATSPTPLIAGSVRDQYGAVIVGAEVSANGRHVRTDAAGTFALVVTGATKVTIRCAYCATVDFPVPAGEPIVAIVRRYAALAEPSPSERDIAALPYAHAESDLSLKPYTILNTSAGIFPGPRVSDRGSSPAGSLLIDDGIPSYDIVSNASPFFVFPKYDAARAQMYGSVDAFEYGDQASGGIAAVETQPAAGIDSTVLGGNASAARIAQTGDAFSYAADASSDVTTSRQRLDATLREPGGDQTFSATAIGTQDAVATQDNSTLSAAFTGIRLDYNRRRGDRLHASLTADKAGYDASLGRSPFSADWSDFDARLGIASDTPASAFFDIAYRASSGYYDAAGAGIPRLAGTIVQASSNAGIEVRGDRYDIRAGAGAFNVSYSGGTLGYSTPLSTQFVVPSLSAEYALGREWKLSAQGSGSFRLPTLIETYAYGSPIGPGNLPFDRNASVVATLAYTDLQRFAASVTMLDEHVSNLDTGVVNGAGASLVWQIAPWLALRAWQYHFNDSTELNIPVTRYGATPRPATAGSIWLTYENVPGLRIDALYRQDLLNYSPQRHFDAAISGPALGEVRWFAATEAWQGVRYYSAGLRLQPP